MLATRTILGVSLVSGVFYLSACSDDAPLGTTTSQLDDLSCSIPESEIFVGAFRDAIPALTNPELDHFGAPSTSLWQEDDRVLGLLLGDQPIAVPLNVFWWHEIVNLDMDGHSLAITHCPLTGSSVTFDREPQGGVEFGVSGLLFRNNMMMYDRSDGEESLWPQMSLGARCGPQQGTELTVIPSLEMTYGGWQRLHPNTLVVTSNTGAVRDYSQDGYPYGSYDEPSNRQVLFPLSESMDTRHPPKERALGVPSETGWTAFAYENLERLGPFGIVHMGAGDDAYVVFWDGQSRGAMAYRPAAGGEALTFRVDAGRFVDDQTGTVWDMTGIATGGPLAGARLEPVAEAFVAFWFSWPLFFPEIVSWSP